MSAKSLASKSYGIDLFHEILSFMLIDKYILFYVYVR